MNLKLIHNDFEQLSFIDMDQNINSLIFYTAFINNNFDNRVSKLVIKEFEDMFTQLHFNTSLRLQMQMHEECNVGVGDSFYNFIIYMLKQKIRRFKNFWKRILLLN